MSAHMKMRHIEKYPCEVIVTISGRKKIHSYLPTRAIEPLQTFLDKYSESESVDWEVLAKDSIKKHKQAGMVLRGARFRENLSQKKLAKKSGVSQENISRIENGHRVLGETVAKKLAKPLKIDYKLLLEDYI